MIMYVDIKALVHFTRDDTRDKVDVSMNIWSNSQDINIRNTRNFLSPQIFYYFAFIIKINRRNL